MYYPDDIVERVRVENDIVDVIGQYVSLKPKGNSYFGLCPFHKEHTPSFSVSTDKQLFHCFGCGASGNVFSFMMQKENYDFQTAIKVLADRARISLPEEGYSPEAKKQAAERKLIMQAHKEAARYYYDNLVSDRGIDARNYLDGRNMPPKTRVKYGLGYSLPDWDGLYKFLNGKGYKDNLLIKSGLMLKSKQGKLYDRFRDRLMFPIFDVAGNIIGFGGRIIGQGEPKYLNSPESPIFEKSKNLYNLNFARKLNPSELVLVEGYMDVIGLYQAGIENAVASLGTAFNQNHARVLKKYVQSVIILFDSDQAGEAATVKAIPILVENGLRVKVVRLENAKDPDEFANKFGADRLRDAVGNPMSHIAFNIDLMKRKYNIEQDSGRIDFTVQAAKLLMNLPSEIERDVYIGEVSRMTGITENAIRSEIGKNSNAARNINDKRRLNYNLSEKNMLSQKGLVDARKAVVLYAADDKALCGAIKSVIEPGEMGDPVYDRLLKLIGEYHEKGENIYPAELVNHFENPEDQKSVSEVFLTTITPDSTIGKLKALTEQVRKVKEAYIDKKISQTEDLSVVKKLMDDKRNVEKLNISL